MKDVASHAGVSPQTVSRVSMNLDTVRPETRAKVLASMEALGYAPNAAARALRYGSFGAIGVIAHQLGRVGESHTVEGVVNAARAEGYTVAIVDVENPTAAHVDEAINHLSDQAIDGLIIIRAEAAAPENLSLPPRIPVVISDARFVGHHPAVGSDQITGSRAALQHLLDLGHPTVHHVAGPVGSIAARHRADAWREALAAAGRRAPEIVFGDWSADSGYQAGRALAADPAVTAVFCGNDEMAIGVMHALHEAGRRVPDDVSVVGFDDIEIARHVWPPLTTVTHDFSEIGRLLVELLVAQIREPDVAVASSTLVPASLVVRGSTAPPRTT